MATIKSSRVSIRNSMPPRDLILSEFVLILVGGLSGALGYKVFADIDLAFAFIVATVVVTVVVTDFRNARRDSDR